MRTGASTVLASITRADGQAQVTEPIHGQPAQPRRVLTDAAGEGQHVDPTEGGGHRGDAGDETVDVDVEPELRVGRTALDGGFHRTHVGAAGQRQQSRPVFQRGGDLVRSQVLVLFQPQDQPRVDAAGSGGHDQPFQRCEAHGRIDAASVPDGGQ